MQTRNAPPLIELILSIPRYPYRTFADRLRAYRRARGWRQIDLATAIGVNKDTVRNWETGRSEPRLAVLGRKAVAVVGQVAGGAAMGGG
jgi:DNA-binding XRE family transcriptional regulator